MARYRCGPACHADTGRGTRSSSKPRISCGDQLPELEREPHLTERIQRLSEGTLLYTFTVTDPTTWTQPWTVELPMRLSDLPIFEYACHEGNYGMEGTLSGARAVEQTSGQ